MTTKSKTSSKSKTTPGAGKPIAYTTESEFMVSSEITRGQIRTEKLRGLKADLKSETAIADRKEVRTDRMLTKLAIEQEKLGIDEDNLKAVKVHRVLNQAKHVANLSSKSYGVNFTQSLNQGKRQFLMNSGAEPAMDHLGTFSNEIEVEKVKVGLQPKNDKQLEGRGAK